MSKCAKLYDYLRLLLPGLLSFWLLSPAQAEHADRSKPLHFQANRWVYDDLKQINVLTGNVIITKGTILLKADRVTVRRNPEGYQFMTAYSESKQLAYFRQKLDGGNEYIEGYGKQIDYDGKQEVTILKQQARMRRLQGLTKITDEVQSATIRYEAQKNLYTAESEQGTAAPTNPAKRVRAMLLPLQRPSTPSSSAFIHNQP